MLIALILFPLLAAVAIFFGAAARKTAVLAGMLTLLTALVTAVLWSGNPEFGRCALPVLEKPAIGLDLAYYDGMSVVMVLLAAFVMYAALQSGQCPEGREKLWYTSSLLIGAGALGSFLSTNVFFFYAFHELALVPTFLMIGMLGRGDRSETAWKVTIYLALGSVILLVGLLWLTAEAGSMDISEILGASIETEAQRGISAFLLVGFGILVSLFPFHSWAAPAYASAPAPVAMLHAGVLKKFGLYGLFRFAPVLFEGLEAWLTPLVVCFLANIIWVGFVTINQKRLNEMLGASSVMHMGYIFLGFAALVASQGTNQLALHGSVLLMFAHGVSIALLFLLADRVEHASGTLEFRELGGVAALAPKFAFVFGIAAFASMGLPGLANFAGEVLVFFAGFQGWQLGEPLGIIQVATIISLWGVVMSAVYMLRAFRKIFHGPTREVPGLEGAGWKGVVSWPALLLAAILLIVGIFPASLGHLLRGEDADAARSVAKVANENFSNR